MRDEISNILFETGRLSFENTQFFQRIHKDEMDIPLFDEKSTPNYRGFATVREKRSG